MKNYKNERTVVERKGLGDLIGTLSGDSFDRFRREIQKAKDDNAYIIVLIEDTFNHFMGFNYLPHIFKKVKVTPEYIAHRVKDILYEFSNIQFVFCNGRVKAAELTKLFLYNCDYFKNVDIQLLIDTKKI